MQEITFLGDTFLPTPITAELPYERIVLNLEAPITKYELGAASKINLRTVENNLPAVFGGKITAVCLANNHIFDYRIRGFEDTIAQLQSNDISWFGAGCDIGEAADSLVIEVGTKKLALLGFVCSSTSPILANADQPGVAAIDKELIRVAITTAQESGADFIAVSFHWGAEHVSLPKPEDISIARFTIDCGADLVIGHHAHCIQGFDIYKDKHIFYGIGNCIFPDFVAPAMFDQDGRKPGRQFVSKQERWNKISLAVRINLSRGSVVADKLLFSDNRIVVLKSNFMPFRVRFSNNSFYRLIFQFVFVSSKLRSIFMRFLRNPKMPNTGHIRALIKLARTRNYS